jgi:hypothetical protein
VIFGSKFQTHSFPYQGTEGDWKVFNEAACLSNIVSFDFQKKRHAVGAPPGEECVNLGQELQ